MKVSPTVSRLSLLTAALATFAAAAGVFWRDGGAPFAWTTVRGETARAFGEGIYRYDSLFSGAAYRGTDMVTLAVGVPSLLLALALYRRGSRAGAMLLTGALTYFLYVYATMSVAAAYNALFLVYVGIFSASFFAFVLAFDAVRPLAARFSDRLPRRGIGAFLIASGVLTLFVWLEGPVSGLVQGGPPALLAGHTTLVTHALDLAVIVPAVFASGILLLRGDPRGYVIGFPLIVLIVMLVPVIAMQTVMQVSVGITYTTPEIVGPIGGFLVLGSIGAWIAARMLRDLSAVVPSEEAEAVGIGSAPRAGRRRELRAADRSRTRGPPGGRAPRPSGQRPRRQIDLACAGTTCPGVHPRDT